MTVSQNNIELRKQNCGMWLAHWDSIHGDDVIIQIYPDKTATIRRNGIEKPCDLASALIKLANLICD